MNQHSSSGPEQRPANQTRTWSEIIRDDEASRIKTRRQVAFGFKSPQEACDEPADPGPVKDLFGLSLSGGGSRSALFNDGFLQALSHRGVLRFVDYLSSVSGGGYTAGHLIASGVRYSNEQLPTVSDEGAAPPARDPAHNEMKAAASFHDNPDCYFMGKHPVTGKREPGRLEGAGRYLKQQATFFFFYLACQAITWAFYLGVVGMMTTVIVLCWRSLDYEPYRRALELLGFTYGGELFIAFIPCVIVAMLWGIFLAGCVALRISPRLFERTRERSLQINRLLGLSVASSAIIGVAVFLGNDWTGAGGEGSEMFLNGIAQWLIMAAAIVQLAVFFGTDKLFASEKSSASHWQRVAQITVTYTVVGLAVFAMLHWMCHENISDYTLRRDLYLVRGDVQDWQVAAVAGKWLGVEEEKEKDLTEAMVRTEDALSQRTGESSWRRHQQLGALLVVDGGTKPEPAGVDFDEDADPTDPIIYGSTLGRWGQLLRITAASFVIGDSTGLYPRDLREVIEGVIEPENEAKEVFVESLNQKLDDPDTTKQLIVAIFGAVVPGQSQSEEKTRDGQLVLRSPLGFDLVLMRRAGRGERIPVSQLATWQLHRSKLREYLDKHVDRHTSWSNDGVDELMREMDWALQRGWSTPDNAQGSVRRRYLHLNLALLDLLYPQMLKNRKIASTPVVIMHDQHQRRRWFGFWLLVALIGFLGSFKINMHTPMYRYYRRMLTEKFLVGWTGKPPKDRLNEGPRLSDCDPTNVGLAYPLLLGTLLREVPHDGDLRIDRQPFLFTPAYLGVSNEEDRQTAVGSSDYVIPGYGEPIGLADAVAISGSAVAPFMTQNRALRIIMDLFNVRLGQWLGNPRQPNRIPFLGYATVIWENMHLVRALVSRLAGPASGGSLDWQHGFVADGGFVDYFGVSELLRRKCKLILVTDAGSNQADEELATLAQMMEDASTQLGVTFLDLDHNAPIDFGRLRRVGGKIAPQPYICLRIRYKPTDAQALYDESNDGYLIYAQMAITESDPIEIQQIRHRFPSFPDEPTSNQFYTEEQVAAYRRLGYYIGDRICHEIDLWKPNEISGAAPMERFRGRPNKGLDEMGGAAATEQQRSLGKAPGLYLGEATSGQVSDAVSSGQEQPLFRTLVNRLLVGFRQTCYEELSYKGDDIYAEAVWDRDDWCFGGFTKAVTKVADSVQKGLDNTDYAGLTGLELERAMCRTCEYWLRAYEENADVRGAYRRGVFFGSNSALVSIHKDKAYDSDHLYVRLEGTLSGGVPSSAAEKLAAAAHLTVIAVAAHQMHRGSGKSVFQIGGREKLIDLIVSVVLGTENFDLKWLQEACSEVIELRRCVFHRAEVETAVSFTNLLVMFVKRRLDPQCRQPPKAKDRDDIRRLIRYNRFHELPAKVVAMAASYRSAIEEPPVGQVPKQG